MLRHPRIRMKPLANLCRRVGTSLETGIDMRTVWAREAARVSGGERAVMNRIVTAVGQGKSLAQAIGNEDCYFPDILVELVEVGESSGKLPEIFFGLADHYEHLLDLRRVYLLGILWPALQLGVAIVVVGLVILLTGVIGQMSEEPIDILGFGLVGTQGLVIYIGIILSIAGGVGFLIQAIVRGWIPREPWIRAMMHVPGLGLFLQTVALSRMAWTMSLATETDMDARKVLILGLKSTRNPTYISLSRGVADAVTRGADMTTALRQTGKFPTDFLDGIAIGEQTGRMSESLRQLFEQYKVRTQSASKAMAVVASLVTWAMVGLVIIFMIFRLFMFYVGTIYDAMQPL